MKRTWTIIGVSDVPGSFKWYQSLFGQPETSPCHDDFGQILDTDGTVLLYLHQWGRARASLLDEPGRGVTWQWAPPVLPRRRFQHGIEQGPRACHPGSKRSPT